MRILTFIFILLYLGCTTPQKSYSKKDYKKAYTLAFSRIHKKKADDYLILEKVYKLFLEENQAHIMQLKKGGISGKWESLIQVYQKQGRIQNEIKAQLPLIAKNGFEPKFKFIPIERPIENLRKDQIKYQFNENISSIQQATKLDWVGNWDKLIRLYQGHSKLKVQMEAYFGKSKTFDVFDVKREIGLIFNHRINYFYEIGLEFYLKAKTGDKASARRAYSFLSKVKKYNPNYKNTGNLIREALKIGTVNVYVEMNGSSHIPSYLMDKIHLTEGLKSKNWTKFTTNPNLESDYSAILIVENISIQKPQVIERNFENVKTISVEHIIPIEQRIDSNTVKIVDSIYYEDLIISALVNEVNQDLIATVIGKILIKDRNHIIDNISLMDKYELHNTSIRFSGDKRALDPCYLDFIHNPIIIFPTRDEVSLACISLLQDQFVKRINVFKF